MMQRLALIGLVTSFCLWAACAAWNVGGQRSLFCEEGRTLLCDYWMPRTCLDEGYAEVGDKFVVSTCLWLVVLCPLQLMLAGHSANGPLCNACLVALCAVTAKERHD